MTTVLDRPTSPADQLRTTMAAVRVSLKWFGTRKSLTAEQEAEAAEPFGAEAKFISAGKKLLDTTHPAYKAVNAVRGKVQAFWKSMSLPYPEPGIRLIRQQKIDAFAAQMREFQIEAPAMQIIIEPDGAVRCIYTEEIDLAAIGSPMITRASHVEPDQQGGWQADMSPVGGELLRPFDYRSEALEAEHAWLEEYWLAMES